MVKQRAVVPLFVLMELIAWSASSPIGFSRKRSLTPTGYYKTPNELARRAHLETFFSPTHRTKPFTAHMLRNTQIVTHKQQPTLHKPNDPKDARNIRQQTTELGHLPSRSISSSIQPKQQRLGHGTLSVARALCHFAS